MCPEYLAGWVDVHCSVDVAVTVSAKGLARAAASFCLKPWGRRYGHVVRHLPQVLRDHMQVGRISHAGVGQALELHVDGCNGEDQVVAAYILQSIQLWHVSRVQLLAFCAVVLLGRGRR